MAKPLNESERPRKKCGTCVYRTDGRRRGCNFILITGKRRGCSVDKCTRYIKGKRLHIAKNPRWSGNGLEETWEN